MKYPDSPRLPSGLTGEILRCRRRPSSALHLQHSNSNSSLGLLPAWPCDIWSVSFKLHAPGLTTIEGSYNHTTAELCIDVQPPRRRDDVVVMGCAKRVMQHAFTCSLNASL